MVHFELVHKYLLLTREMLQNNCQCDWRPYELGMVRDINRKKSIKNATVAFLHCVAISEQAAKD